MKKASKILTLILVFVLLASIFGGCSMFGRDAAKYRDMTAVKVGGENITVGKILDTFNNYYNTYSAYIGQGITTESLLQMTMQSLVTQAMKVDSYVKDNQPAADNTALKDVCHNAQYLTKDEIEFCIKYVKYLTFQTFDSSVLNLLSVGRTVADEEKEDTSRDFTEIVDLEGREYSEYTYRQRVFNKDAEEYFDEFYKNVEIKSTLDVKEYVYASEDVASPMLEKLNKRLDKEDDKITFTEYKDAQERVAKQYARSIKNTYNIEFEEFMKNQISDMVASTIAAKYDYSINKAIDTTDLDNTLKQLNDNLKINSDAQAAGFALNDNFVSFIEGLSSTSYIYNVPEAYARVNTADKQSGYIFVKNILIPFTAQQSAILANLAKDLGGDTTNAKYVELRNKYAAAIVADDFNSEKDEDGKYQKIEGIFALKDGEVIINPNGELKDVFKSDGTVEGGVDAVIANMKRFNTDTAQHTAQYDYVVRVGETPSGYTHKWVTEFVDAANVAAKQGVGTYALAVSTYGVHIVYYSADVEAQQIEFAKAESGQTPKYLQTTTPEYRLFSAYFSQQSSRLLEEAATALQKSYLDGNLIETNKYFDRFLKDNNFKFDLIEYLTDED